ncbi:hypothetical protein DYU11_22685 [Fibrisoma montanum]|uniref:Uncharacterized protein n=1 Tax=Fibrisoma montanum TaxID=2305895 RepID=A0A418M2G3_9BACT|nr:hypothetical protein [Fibrisoma montanum]RIV19739.1 hypothetical protein DYU11_22685 [Fibrisoma montanum]
MTTIDAATVIERMRFWKKQPDVACFNFSEQGVRRGTHYPNIVLANGSGYMLTWPGDHEEAVRHQQKLTSGSKPQQLALF